mgnify:CR=1 FL=1
MPGETDQSIEEDRIGRLANLGEDANRSRFAPGSFGCHELLDRASLLSNAVDDWLLGHPACLKRPEWFRLARSAFDSLHELYNRVADVHLDSDAGPTDDPRHDQGR